MAAIATTYFGVNHGWPARIAERNAELRSQQQARRRGMRTPEVYFTKSFDNTRLVKASDPVRVREMRLFSAAITVLFSLVMIYGLQHFSAIEGGYNVEAEKQRVEQLREENRQLKLAEAQLTQPGRIDSMARQLGLAEPQPGQVIHPTAHVDAATPVVAQVTPPPAP
jgi:cell division protein FtsL